ncbi:MAG: hypothetical protein RR701_05450 [Comamonas sp.]
MTGASRLWPWLAFALAALATFQSQRLASSQVSLAQLEASQSKQAVAQAEKAQAATENKAGALLQHATNQQSNTHDYMQKLAALEVGRAADAVRIAGLQHDIRSAATRKARAASDAAACRDLADQHQRLAAIAAEGAELVGELGGLVQRRDGEIALLQGQLVADRELLVAVTQR